MPLLGHVRRDGQEIADKSGIVTGPLPVVEFEAPRHMDAQTGLVLTERLTDRFETAQTRVTAGPPPAPQKEVAEPPRGNASLIEILGPRGVEPIELGAPRLRAPVPDPSLRIFRGGHVLAFDDPGIQDAHVVRFRVSPSADGRLRAVDPAANAVE